MGAGGFSRARLIRMSLVMAGHVERGSAPGLAFMVGRGGEIHGDALGWTAEGEAPPIRRDAIFRIASLTKPITAAAAMILVEECRLRLDDPVDAWLPELAGRRVLRRPDGPLDDTVPAIRPITLRDLLTFRMGLGAVMAPRGRYPIQAALAQAGLEPGPNPPPLTPDAWMAAVGALPLMRQPGEAWLYHTGSDVLGVLIARAAGQDFEDFLRERLLEPLGMKDTGFHIPARKLDRLPTCYRSDPAGGGLAIHDEPADSRWANPPAFASGGGGLVSTVDDYFAFCAMMLNKGVHDGRRILSRPSIELMTMDHLTADQRAANGGILGAGQGWGFGMTVATERRGLAAPGQFGWNGGTGTTAYCDPAEGLIGVLMTQRMMESPDPPAVFQDFWTSAYQAIDD